PTMLEEIVQRVDAGEPVIMPFHLVSAPSSPQQQKDCATRFFAANCVAADVLPPVVTQRREKIRLGYVSPDFYDHATVHLIEGMLAHHDRARFEVFAFARGGAPTDAARQRIVKTVDTFVDVSTLAESD